MRRGPFQVFPQAPLNAAEKGEIMVIHSFQWILVMAGEEAAGEDWLFICSTLK